MNFSDVRNEINIMSLLYLIYCRKCLVNTHLQGDNQIKAYTFIQCKLCSILNWKSEGTISCYLCTKLYLLEADTLTFLACRSRNWLTLVILEGSFLFYFFSLKSVFPLIIKENEHYAHWERDCNYVIKH